MPVTGTLDLVDKLLEKYKDRLNGLHRPLSYLSGAVVCLLLVALMIGAPILVFPDKIVHVVATQVLLLAIFYVLLRAIRQNVFDRFVFCVVLFLVLTAAPVAIHVQWRFDQLRKDNPEHAEDLKAGFSATEVFSYGVIRGIGNTAWALPLLFYFYTFYPRLESGSPQGVRKALDVSLVFALAFWLVTAALIVWQEAIRQRAFAPTRGAAGFVKEAIEANQKAFLAFSVLYLAIGLLAIAIVWKLRPVSDGRLLLIVTAALAAVWLSYAIASYNVLELDSRYPAARSTGGAISAYRSRQTQEVVFVRETAFQYVGSGKLEQMSVFSACRNPESGRFSQRVVDAADLRRDFTSVDLGLVRAEERDALFCQPN